MPPKPPPPPAKPSHLVSAPSTRPSKRGLGWPWDHPASLFSLYAPSTPHRISWLFNWELWRPDGIPATVQWVPCIRTAAHINDLDPFLSDIRRTHEIKHLLGFNEPEVADQANLAVDEAVRLWMGCVLPAKQKFGVRLGAPGMSSDRARSVQWLDGFFEGCGGVDASGVDFLVCHWYGPEWAGCRQWLEEMHARYALNVWVNEWACSRMGDGRSGEGDVEGFLREGCQWMDGCAWVERYAYFGLGQGGSVGAWVGEGSDFVEGVDGGDGSGGKKLTRLGRVYCE